MALLSNYLTQSEWSSAAAARAHMIAKVISGGQTGVDIAALVAAKLEGMPTGGLMPKGFQAQDGMHPEYAELFGMTEDVSSKNAYRARTWRNVQSADATLRIALHWLSPGERCTAAAIQKCKKPHFDISVTTRGASIYSYVETDMILAVSWVRGLVLGLGRPIVLNVAGNSDKTAPGIGKVAQEIVQRVLRRIASGA